MTEEKFVLVADDQEIFRRPLVDMINIHSGVSALGVENGQQLVDEAGQRDTYLVITDNSMPEKKGVDAIRELRSRGYEGKIWMHAGGYPKLRELVLQAGADRFYEKGEQTDELHVAIREEFGGSK